ncbi:uncharacterized protein LOC128234183 [Mya arenaria]|uniref:uncharacterized protein LOC128234183 n=1 Tax=Mya arenaria TaxID=6604 RepID=UPI0022E00BB9|nr:uncharacterized protein LOC128234183 [Mya arenaria]
MSAQNRMTMFQGCIMGVLLVCLNACSAAVTILGEDKKYCDANKPLSIECELNDSTTDIDFRFNHITVVSCEPLFGCSITDSAYNVTKTDYSYILHTVNNFNATGCGVYQCTDIKSRVCDTVNVTYKKFNIDADNIEEQDLSLTIPTTCVFPSENITVTWFYTIENSTQQLDLESDSSFIKTVNKTDTCSNGTCNAKLAKEKTSFGLKFSETTGQYVYSVIEVRIVHPSFKDQPSLTYQSLKKYPVKEIKTVPASNPNYVMYAFIVLLLPLLIYLSIHVLIWIKIRDLTLFAFIRNTWTIAWNMSFAREALDDSHFYVLVNGKIVLNSSTKTITPGDAFAKFDLIYGMAEKPIEMNSVITVKNEKSGATARIFALSRFDFLVKSDDVWLLKLERKKYNEILMVQKRAEWKYTLYQEMLTECLLFKEFDLQTKQMVASDFEAICFRDGDDILSPHRTTKDTRINVEGSESQQTGAGDKKTSHGLVYFRCIEIEPEECDDKQTIVEGSKASEDVFIITEGAAVATDSADNHIQVQAEYNKFDYLDKSEPEECDDKQSSVEGSETSEDVTIISEGAAVATDSADNHIRVQAEYNKFDYLGYDVSKTIYRSVIADGPILCAKLCSKYYQTNGSQNWIDVK